MIFDSSVFFFFTFFVLNYVSLTFTKQGNKDKKIIIAMTFFFFDFALHLAFDVSGESFILLLLCVMMMTCVATSHRFLLYLLIHFSYDTSPLVVEIHRKTPYIIIHYICSLLFITALSIFNLYSFNNFSLIYTNTHCIHSSHTS